MPALKKLIDTIAPYSFLIKFLLLFAFLYLLLPFFQGVAAPGGGLHFTFVENYLNVVKGLTSFLTGTAKALLELLEYRTWQRDYQTLRIESSRGVVINPSCLGWGVMSFWGAFVIANKGSWRHKIKWLFIGISSVLFLNILRIAVLAIANHLKWGAITSLDPHLTFNILSYCIIIIMVVWFVAMQKKYEVRGA